MFFQIQMIYLYLILCFCYLQKEKTNLCFCWQETDRRNPYTLLTQSRPHHYMHIKSAPIAFRKKTSLKASIWMLRQAINTRPHFLNTNKSIRPCLNKNINESLFFFFSTIWQIQLQSRPNSPKTLVLVGAKISLFFKICYIYELILMKGRSVIISNKYI